MPSTAFIGENEKPVVWFTYRQDWEPTPNKLWANPDGTVRRLTREETEELGGGLFRIEIEPDAALAPVRIKRRAPKTSSWLRQVAMNERSPQPAAGFPNSKLSTEPG